MATMPYCDHKAIATRVLKMLSSLVGVPTFFVSRFDALSLLTIESALNLTETLVQEDGQLCPETEACLQAVCREGKYVVVQHRPDRTEAVAESLQITAFLGVPIILEDGRLYGAICAVDTKPYSFSAEEVESAESLALFLSNAVDLGKSKHPGAQSEGSPYPHMPDRLAFQAELRLALHEREFRLVYQPIVNLATGHIDRMEALIRWEHPERGVITPAEFIPCAEESGLITKIGEWVLRNACHEQQRWENLTPGVAPRLNVNLSARQFQEASLPELVKSILEETGMDPASLLLEITESTLMNDVGAAVCIMSQLKAIGVSLAVDDFGKGYSSLTYLKEFPIDCIKIDRAFTNGLGKNPKDEAIVRSVLTLGQSLGMQVIAEGVETPEQKEYLHQCGCDNGQGFLFAPPLTPDQVMLMLSTAAC